MPADSHEYTCSCCGKRCISSYPTAEADKEAEKVFGVKNASKDPDMRIVCDDCYHEIMQFMRRKEY